VLGVSPGSGTASEEVEAVLAFKPAARRSCYVAPLQGFGRTRCLSGHRGTVDKLPSLRTYDLFISHAWTYGDDYFRLVDLLDGAPNFQWRNFSVPADDPIHSGTQRELHAALERQVGRVHAVLMLSGMYAAHSGWMQRELSMAQEYAKPIIGVFPWGNQRASSAVQNAADEMVGWNTATIVSAIRRQSI
jgi:hypothetical protein